jgi:hypothetical protein
MDTSHIERRIKAREREAEIRAKELERKIKARERVAEARRRAYEAEIREAAGAEEEGGVGGLIEKSGLQATSN